jgi:hypothetical protein
MRRVMTLQQLGDWLDDNEMELFVGVPGGTNVVGAGDSTSTVNPDTGQVLSQYATWSTTSYNNVTGSMQLLPANNKRVVLIIQNIGTSAIAINFGSQAQLNSPQNTINGIMLAASLAAGSPGGVIYVDRNCMWDSIFMATDLLGTATASLSVTQGTLVQSGS